MKLVRALLMLATTALALASGSAYAQASCASIVATSPRYRWPA